MTMAALVEYEPTIRGVAFVTLLAVLAVAERLHPCRGDARPASRQVVNLALVAVNSMLMRGVFPVLGVGLAARLSADGIGLFAAVVWPEPLAVAAAMLGDARVPSAARAAASNARLLRLASRP